MLLSYTKRASDCREGDIVLLRTGEPRIITKRYFPHHLDRHEPYGFEFGYLDENPRKHFRVETYSASDRLEYLGTQEALF